MCVRIGQGRIPPASPPTRQPNVPCIQHKPACSHAKLVDAILFFTTHQHIGDSTRGRNGVLKASSRDGRERADHRLALAERTLKPRVNAALRATAVQASGQGELHGRTVSPRTLAHRHCNERERDEGVSAGVQGERRSLWELFVRLWQASQVLYK